MMNLLILLCIIYSVYSINCPANFFSNGKCMTDHEHYYGYVKEIFNHFLDAEKKINNIESLKMYVNNLINSITNKSTDFDLNKIKNFNFINCCKFLDIFELENNYNNLYLYNNCELIIYDHIIIQNKLLKNLNKIKKHNITDTNEIKNILIELKINIINKQENNLT